MGAFPLSLDPNDPRLKLFANPTPPTPAAQALLPASNAGSTALAAYPSPSPSGTLITPNQFRAQQRALSLIPNPSAAGVTAMSTMAAVPDMDAPSSPSVGLLPSAPGARLGVDQGELQRLQQTGSGVSQIHNPWARGFARVGDGVLSILAPGVAAAVPGTTMHNLQLQSQAAGRIGQDQGQLQAGAQLQDTQSQSQQRAALSQLELDRGYAALNPKPAQATPGHLVMSGDGSAAGYQDGAGNLLDLNDPAVPQGARAVAQNMAAKPSKVPTAETPLTSEEATRLNAVWDGLAGQHHLPKGQFAAGMTHGDASTLAAQLNNVVGKQQGDTHITVQVQGQQQRADAAGQRNAPLDTSDPATAASVQSVANGSIKLQDVFGRGATTAQKAQFVAAVKAVNPGYNSGDHDIENKARAYYTGGGGGGQTLTAFNAAQNHLQILSQAADALNNGNVQLFNKLSNSYATATGDEAPTDFNAVKNAVKGEVARALTGHVTVSEQAELDKDLNSDMSPSQVSGVSRKYIGLINGKKQAMQQNYAASQQGRPDFGGGVSSQSGPPTPSTHAWSASGWQSSHPGQDVKAATVAAKQAGFQVVN